jgi:hypothetical protein
MKKSTLSLIEIISTNKDNAFYTVNIKFKYVLAIIKTLVLIVHKVWCLYYVLAFLSRNKILSFINSK